MIKLMFHLHRNCRRDDNYKLMNDKYGKVKIPQGMYAIYHFLIVEMISNYIEKLESMMYYDIYIL